MRSQIGRARQAGRERALGVWDRFLGPRVARLYQFDLVYRTDNFASTKWLGRPIWQNVLDLWTIQEAISEIRPALIIETGTHMGGSALFYAQLLELLDGGRVTTIDIVQIHELEHPRITFVHGSSIDPDVVERVGAEAVEVDGPVMVILDGNHDREHVAKELELYAPMVTQGSLLLSQDGVIDVMRGFRDSRPGPLDANRDFLARHPEFRYEAELNERFRLTHHPLGWMRRIS